MASFLSLMAEETPGSPSWPLEATALLGAHGWLEWHAQLPLDSENALMSSKRGKDTGEWKHTLLFCHWTGLHQQAEDSIKSCMIQSAHTFWMLLCGVLNALAVHPCLTVFHCWSAMGGIQWGSFSNTESLSKITHVPSAVIPVLSEKGIEWGLGQGGFNICCLPTVCQMRI